MEPDEQAPASTGMSEIDEAAAFLTGDDAGGGADLEHEDVPDDGIDPDADLDVDDADEEQGTSDDEDEESEESEDEEEGDDEGEEPEQAAPPPEKKKKPSRTDRLKQVIGRKDAEVQALREERYQWAEVSNGLKLERDHLKNENQMLREALEKMGYTESPEARQLREMQFREQERAFSEQMAQAKAKAEREYQTKLETERRLDALFDEAETYATKLGIDAKYLMFSFAQGGMKVPLKELAEKIAGKKIQARNATAKKQQAINKKAPNPAKVRRGRSARPTKKPKMGNMDSFIDAGVADIMRWRGA